MPLSPELEPHLIEAARLNNLEPLGLRALLGGESNFDPKAIGPAIPGRSDRAIGIGQFMPDTAKDMGIDPTDPVQSIYGAARLFNDRLTFHEARKAENPNISPVDEALRDYFAGPGGGNRGRLTEGYPSKIKAVYDQLSGGAAAVPTDPVAALAAAPQARKGGDTPGYPRIGTQADANYINQNPIDALAAARGPVPPAGQTARNFTPPAGTPDTLDAAPPGVAALAALSGQGTAPSGQRVGVVPLASTETKAAQGDQSADELLKLLNEVYPASAGASPQPPPSAAPALPQNANPSATMPPPGARISKEDIAWASQMEKDLTLARMPVPATISEMAKMEPGLPLSPEYQQQIAVGQALAQNRQYYDPTARQVKSIPGVVQSDAERAAEVAGGTARGALPYAEPTAAATARGNKQQTLEPATGRVVNQPGSPEADAEREAAVAKARTDEQIRGQREGVIAERSAKDFYDRRTKALSARESLQNLQQANAILDKGIISGFGANFKLGAGRALMAVGYIPKESDDAKIIANTETYMAARNRELAPIMKDFGAGSGLSDNDAKIASRIAAGDIDLTEQGIRDTLRVGEIVARNALKDFNDEAVKFDPENKHNTRIPDLNPLPRYDQPGGGRGASSSAGQTPPIPGAVLGPDGFWYGEIDGKPHRFRPPPQGAR